MKESVILDPAIDYYFSCSGWTHHLVVYLLELALISVSTFENRSCESHVEHVTASYCPFCFATSPNLYKFHLDLNSDRVSLMIYRSVYTAWVMVHIFFLIELFWPLRPTWISVLTNFLCGLPLRAWGWYLIRCYPISAYSLKLRLFPWCLAWEEINTERTIKKCNSVLIGRNLYVTAHNDQV